MLMLTQSYLKNKKKQDFIFTQTSYLLLIKSATFERKNAEDSVTGKMTDAPLAPPDQSQVQVQVERKILHSPC